MAYFGPRYEGGTPLEENWIGLGSEGLRGTDPLPGRVPAGGAALADVGERSNPILLPMLIAALEQILAWGPEHIQAYCGSLTAEFAEQAREMGFAVQETGRASPSSAYARPPG